MLHTAGRDRHHGANGCNTFDVQRQVAACLTRTFEIYASDGGIQFVRKMYRDAANGHPANLIQSCRANGPVGTR